MAKRINMELHVKDKGTAKIKRFSETTRATMSKLAGVVGVAGLGLAFANLTKQTIAYGDKLNKLNIQLGISVTQLDKLKRVGEFAGVSMEQITSSIRLMARNLNDAADGTGLAKDALAELNINAVEFLNMNPDKAFVKIAEALTTIENPTKRAALAMDIFGRSGTVVIQMAKDLDKNLEEMNTNWDNDKAQNAADFNDQITEFRHIAEDLAVNILPTLNTWMQNLGESVKWLKAVFGETNQEWVTADERVIKLTDTLTKLFARQVELERASKGKYGDQFTSQLESTKKAIERTTKALGELSQKRREEAAERKRDEAERGVPITDIRVGKVTPIDNTAMIEQLKKLQQLEVEAREETERALNEARAEGMLESARMAEEALNAETERMNAEIEAEKQKIAEITKLEEEAAKQRQALIDTSAQFFSDRFADAFSDWTTGTKEFEDAWKEMLGSMMEDLSRMLASAAFRELFALASNTGAGGGFFGAVGGLFGFAGGGSVSEGRPVLVGERGPEIFIPNGSGRIDPNVGGSTNVINTTVNVAGQNGNQSEAENQRFGKIIAEQVKDQVKAVMVDEQRYGGLLNRRQY
jgi:hypothetical protein